MPNLLNIAFELRAQIIDLVINAERRPPSEYHGNEDRICIIRNKYWTIGHGVEYETDPTAYHSNTTSLLLVNHQVREETSALLARQSLKYKIDIAIMQGRVFWPTWICIPTTTRVVDVVEIKVRGTGPGPPCVRQFQSPNREIPPAVWSFYSILEEFLEGGFIPSERKYVVPGSGGAKTFIFPRGRKMSMKLLDIDFVEPVIPFEQPRYGLHLWGYDPFSGTYIDETDGKVRMYPHCSHCKQRCAAARTFLWQRDLGAETLYSFLAWRIRSLIGIARCGRHWNKPLFEGVGTIRIRLRGELKEEHDLRQLLLGHISGHDYHEAWCREMLVLKGQQGSDTGTC